MAHADLDKVWKIIESMTTKRESAYTLWPAGKYDLIDHLFIAVDDFTDAEAEELVASEYDEKDSNHLTTVKKRKCHVEWEKLTGVNATRISDIRNKVKSVDIRKDITHDRSVIVKVKSVATTPVKGVR